MLVQIMVISRQAIFSFMSLVTLLRSMEFSIKFDTVKPGRSIVYIEESQVIILNMYFSEDRFSLSTQCIP